MDAGDIAHADDTVIVGEEGEAPDLVDRLSALADRDGVEAALILDDPGLADVLELREALLDAPEAQAERADAVLIEFDLEEAGAAAGGDDIGDAIDLVEFGDDLFLDMRPERFQGVGPGDGVLEEGAGLVLELAGYVAADLGACGRRG
jgi:hypothetical protein